LSDVVNSLQSAGEIPGAFFIAIFEGR